SDQLIGFGPDHVPRTVELPVKQESADIARPAQERDEGITREPLGYIPPSVHEVAPHRADCPVVRPDEERPAPVPAPAQVLTGGPPRRRSPEDEETGRSAERLQRGQGPRTQRGCPVTREDLRAPAGGEVYLDDLGSRLQQGA